MRKLLSLLVFVSLLFGFGAIAQAEETHVELSTEKKLELLTNIALEKGIPPEILKAVALNEKGNLKQFENGEPYVSADGGIGIMQITNPGIPYDEERIKTDTAYNIEIGAEVLKRKFDLYAIPTVNDGNAKVLENWYFAIWAYNGLSERNDLNHRDQEETYSYEVYDYIERYSNVEAYPEDITFETTYSGTVANFPEDRVTTKQQTYSTQMFEINDEAFVMNDADADANLRSEPSTDSTRIGKLSHYTRVNILSEPIIDTSNFNNHFVYYKIELPDGQIAYTASSNLRDMEMFPFNEFKNEPEFNELVSVDKDWKITFETPLNKASVTRENIFILDDQGNSVPIRLEYTEGDEFVRVYPTETYQSGGHYTLYVKDIVSTYECEMNKPIWFSFGVE